MPEIEINIIPQNNIINIEINENGFGNINVLPLTGANTSIYTDSTLIGKNILFIFIDAQKISRNAFTFSVITGTVDFVSIIDEGAEIDILYL